jgi:hypothetical protein
MFVKVCFFVVTSLLLAIKPILAIGKNFRREKGHFYEEI